MAHRRALSISTSIQPSVARISRFAQQERGNHNHAHNFNHNSYATLAAVGSAVAAAVVGVVGYAVGTHWTVAINPLDPSACQELQNDKQQEGTINESICYNRRNKKGFSGSKLLLAKTIQESTDIVQRIKDEVGTPGLSISVSVDGKEIWSDGLGYADLENRVLCTSDTVMRIASISKSITMAIVGRLWQAGKLDIDKSVNKYVPSFPEKEFKGEKTTITTRQLVSHMGGIRHYDKSCEKSVTLTAKKKKKDIDKKEAEAGYDTQIPNKHNKSKSDVTEEETKNDTTSKKGVKTEFKLAEYYIRRHYDSVTDAVKLFQNDALCSKPGTEFYYTTHGWSLVAAVAEGASGKEFPLLLKEFFKDIGLEKTFLDENGPIIYNRARYYVKNDRDRIVNAPFVDCSYKWAGGGILSTVRDLNKFGNAMLYAYQQPGTTAPATTEALSRAEPASCTDPIVSTKHAPLPGYLEQATINEIWTPVENTKCSWDSDGSYGMGWAVIPGVRKHGACRDQRFYVSHTGGAIGASSVIVVLPRKPTVSGDTTDHPRGVVVSIIVNLQAVCLNKVALEIAKKFEQLDV